MKIFKPIKAGLLLIIGSLSMLFAQSVMADAGDIISNTVSVVYTTGSTTFDGAGGNPPPPSAIVRFQEDRRVNLTVTETTDPGNSEAVGLGDATINAFMSFSVANTSNAVLDFSLAALNTSDPHGGTDDYDQPVTIYVDSNGNDTFEAADVTANISTINDLCATGMTSGTTNNYNANGSAAATVDCSAGDNTITVFVAATAPAGITGTDGQISAISLVATALAGGDGGALTNTTTADNSTDNGSGAGTAVVSSANQAQTGTTDVTGSTIDTVFADSDSGGGENLQTGGIADVANNGEASDSDSFLVSAANLSVLKTVQTVFDPVTCTAVDPLNPTGAEITACSNPKAIPGAFVEYSLIVDNDGTAVANTINIQDTIPAGTVFHAGSLVIRVNGNDLLLADPGAAISVTTMDIGGGTVPLVLQADDSAGAVGSDAENTGDDLDEALVTFRVRIQ